METVVTPLKIANIIRFNKVFQMFPSLEIYFGVLVEGIKKYPFLVWLLSWINLTLIPTTMSPLLLLEAPKWALEWSWEGACQVMAARGSRGGSHIGLLCWPCIFSSSFSLFADGNGRRQNFHSSAKLWNLNFLIIFLGISVHECFWW